MPVRLLCCTALAALVVVGCVPPPEDVDTVADFDPEETRMGVIQERGVLRVALPDGPRPPFSFPLDDGYDGFIVDLAREVATALDVEMRFVPAPPDTLLEQIVPADPGKGRGADLSFAVVPMTEKLVKEYPMTHPYYVAHQRLLVRKGSGVADVENLAGHSVCAVVDPQTAPDLGKLNPEAKLLEAQDPGECALLLENDQVDVVSATDVDLMTVWAAVSGCTQPCPPSPEFAIVGDELSTIALGAAVPGGGGWNNFVNATWAETDAEGRWLEFQEKWIGPYGLELDAPPEMTVEEGAGLFPQGF